MTTGDAPLGGAPAQNEAAASAPPNAAPMDTAASGTRVDFYVIQSDSARERLRTACRVVEKAYLAGHTVLVWHTDIEELRDFDELLWTFGDGSFVPHEAITTAGFAAAP